MIRMNDKQTNSCVKKMCMLAGAACALLWAGCGGQEEPPAEPQTPQEMYEQVSKLLMPNVEHDASDFAQAMVWLRRAAEGGHLQAQTDLGGIYLEGGKGGVQPDGKQAYEWFSRAAAQGSNEALYYMGLILYNGRDMPEDKTQAMLLWSKAANAGVGEAQLQLGLALARLSQAEAVEQGVRWLIRAVQTPVPKTAAEAACALGNIYAKGRPGVPPDMAEASRWYKLAADGGDAAAQLVYALILMNEQDESQGLRYLRMSAGQDNKAAMRLLIKHLNEHGAPQEAAAWDQRLKSL